MNYDFKEEFEGKNVLVRDWNYYMDEVYDYLNIFTKQLEQYKEYFEDYISKNQLSSDEIKLVCKNLLYISNQMSYFPSNAAVLSNEIYSIFKPLLEKTDEFSTKISSYIEFLNKLISREKIVLSEYEKIRDAYFDRDLSTLAKRKMLNPEQIKQEWEIEKEKAIESGEDFRWHDVYGKFFSSVFVNHKEEIEKNKKTEEYQKINSEAISDLVTEINSRLNK